MVVMACGVLMVLLPGSEPKVEKMVRLEFNGIYLGQNVAEIERRLGPPNFTWDHSSSQQWEPRRGWFTRIQYRTDDDGSRWVVSVEGTGVLTLGGEKLVAFGDPKALMLKNLGPAPQIEDSALHRYDGFVINCGDLVGMITLDGQEALPGVDPGPPPESLRR